MNKQHPEKGIGWCDYKIGYIAGMTEGDGTFKMPVPGKTYQESQWYWRVALVDVKILKRVRQYLRSLGIRLSIKPFNLEMNKLETRQGKILGKIYVFLNPEIISEEYSRGYLAGIFDAEGSWHRSNLRIYNSSKILINKIIANAGYLGFTFIEEDYPSKKGNGVRLKGDRYEQARFLCVIKSIKSRYYLRNICWSKK